ncbi:GrpB family protein [Halogeometricum borinquense]|uniref:GrpB family protein n=1 Tax=Halogeometricum borinquense TaxID=60847 RepID=A0A6C0UM83_9EURY|nr:GrpB family protein [Halogeometricum borinquense]QIB75471.1 GrpB family protein [Halogeometricum borinquense]
MVGLARGTVKLESHRTEWKDRYEKEVNRLTEIAGDRLLDFEHIGSTAISGMPAKPIIDLLAVVRNLEEGKDLTPVLEAHGYEYRPDDDVGGRLFFAKGPRENRTYYLSLAEQNSDFFEEKVAFREYLREHAAVADEYASLKRNLAEQYPETRETYTANKGAFIESVLDRAMNE